MLVAMNIPTKVVSDVEHIRAREIDLVWCDEEDALMVDTLLLKWNEWLRLDFFSLRDSTTVGSRLMI
jgi:hypothetical protein